MISSQLRLIHAQGAKERADDGGGDLPIPENYSANALPLSSESEDSRLQAWKRMAIRSFGSGTVDPQPDQTLSQSLTIVVH